MSWGKMDDKFHRNRKVRDLRRLKGGYEAIGVWTFWWSWCLDDAALTGFIPDSELAPNERKSAKMLVSAGLWDEIEGGFRFHDFHDYNPTRDQRESKKSYDREHSARRRSKVVTDSDTTRERIGDESFPARVPVPSQPDPNPIPTETTAVVSPAAAPTSRGASAFFGSFAPKSPIRDTLVAMVTETRGTAVFRPVSWEDQEAVRKLAEWAEAQSDPLGSARASLAAFWAAKGTGARLSWLTDGDPGMYLGKVASRPDLAGLRAELEDANRRYRLADDRIEETFGQEREIAEREAEEARRLVIAIRERLQRAEAA